MNDMYPVFRKILLSFVFCFTILFVNAQVSVSAEISAGQVNKNEMFDYRIVIANAGNIEKLTPPSFKNFSVSSNPSRETGVNVVNGHVTKYIALGFILKPKQQGKFTIDPASVVIDGKLYKTNPVAISVINALGQSAQVNPFAQFDPFAPQQPASVINDYILRDKENIADKISKNMELRLETNKTSCYVGEPVIAAYKLFTRLKSDSKLTQNPSFNGFSVIDMQPADNGGYERQQINGKDYNVYLIRKAQLYALQPGEIDLEPAELENNVQFIKEAYAKGQSDNDIYRMFNNFAISGIPPEGLVNQTVLLKSKPVKITVKPLPEENKPGDFNGAVGSFAINAVLQKDKFSTDEAGKLSVTVSGNGNMQLLTAPDINWPAGIESFEPKLSDDLNKTTVPVSGSKTFEYSFAAAKPGNYSLPAISFSYFDPKTALYKTIATKPVSFFVSRGTGNASTLPNADQQLHNVSFINSIFAHRSWIVIFIAVVVICSLLLWLMKDRKKVKQVSQPIPDTGEATEINNIIAASAMSQQNPLPEAEKCLYRDDCFEFYAVLNTELKNYLALKLSIDTKQINSSTIAIALDKKGIANETVLKLQRLMQDIEWQLYTPFERNEKMNQVYHSTQEIIQMINDHDIRHK